MAGQLSKNETKGQRSLLCEVSRTSAQFRDNIFIIVRSFRFSLQNDRSGPFIVLFDELIERFFKSISRLALV